MEFNCKIEMDGSAIKDDPDELARILRKVAYSVGAGDEDGRCRDANGNTVGMWSITGEDS